jgi:hypothetical protein
MDETSALEFVGYGISGFALGYMASYLITVFKKLSEYI